MLVHKLWGKSRRISEVEKKEIQRLISGRYQTAKEGYKRQIEGAYIQVMGLIFFKIKLAYLKAIDKKYKLHLIFKAYSHCLWSLPD